MKKGFIFLLSVLLIASPAMAANKATVKYGSIKYVSTTAAVASFLGEDVFIVLGGSKGTTAGTFSFTIEASEVAQLAKGLKFDVASIGDDGNDDNAIAILFQGTQIKVNGTSSTTTGYTSNNDTEADGTFKVINYDPDTKVLQFTISAKAAPYTKSVSKLGSTPVNTDVDKPIAISIKGEITLP